MERGGNKFERAPVVKDIKCIKSMKNFVLVGIVACILFGAVVVYQFLYFNDGKLHVVFCNVGQGDGILIKTPSNKYILIDGGPDRGVTTCLGRHMPFWNRKIDLVVLTHPHADHFFGIFYVLERYSVGTFATEDLKNKTTSYEELLRLVEKKKILQKRVLAGDKWRVGEVTVSIIGPTKEYLQQTSPGGTIGESREFASLITLVQYSEVDVLLTGDSQAQGLKEAIKDLSEAIDILQAPHHGSGTGLDAGLLKKLRPNLAVISVGQNNYGHPNKKILDLFKVHDVTVLQTDQVGDVEIVSDGNKWSVY